MFVADPSPDRLVLETRSEPAPLYGASDSSAIPGSYIVRFTSDIENVPGFAQALAAHHGAEVRSVLRGLGGMWISLPEAALQGVRRNPHVDFVEQDAIGYPNAVTVQDVGASNENWGLDRIDQRLLPLNGEYRYFRNGTGAHIWSVGIGLDADDETLGGRVDLQRSFSIDGQPVGDPCWYHETRGIVFAAGERWGVARKATLLEANVANPQGDCDISQNISYGATVTAFDSISRSGVPNAVAVFTWDFGECGWWDLLWGTCRTSLREVMARTVNAGTPVVVAAGNAGKDACRYAHAMEAAVIAVGASDRNDRRVLAENYSVLGNKKWSSNYGSCVDIFAPGIGLDWNSDGFSAAMGTSYSAPLVAGVLATLVPTLSGSAARHTLLSMATEDVLTEIGGGSPNKLLYTHRPLDVEIQGPGSHEPSSSSTWTVQVAGGSGEYTYHWTRDGQLVSTTPSYTYSGADTDFRLTVNVSDATGEGGFDDHYVAVYCGVGCDQPW